MAETPKRKTSGQWIDGKWVNTNISAAEGADDTSATFKAKKQDAAGVGSVKSKPWPNRKDFASEGEWQKAYDARRKEQMGGKPVSAVDPEELIRYRLRQKFGEGTLGSMGRG